MVSYGHRYPCRAYVKCGLAHDLSVKIFGHQKSDKTQYIFLFITVALTLQALFVLSVP